MKTKVFIFERMYIHKECGNRHSPGDITHAAQIEIEAEVYFILCNKCHEHGKWFTELLDGNILWLPGYVIYELQSKGIWVK